MFSLLGSNLLVFYRIGTVGVFESLVRLLEGRSLRGGGEREEF